MRLLGPLDFVRFRRELLRTERGNREFLEEHPDFVAPPKRWMFDAFGSTHYRAYFDQGAAYARHLAGIINKYHPGERLRICEWGCGPGRLLRHLPQLFEGRDARFTGTDYNPVTIEWCRRSIPGVNFLRNDLNPPLPVEDASFDVVYAISVFTHLSEDAHYRWVKEMRRALKPGGILIASFHDFDDRLLPEHKALYQAGKIVVKDGVMEGSKLYVAYHPPSFLETLFGDFATLEREAFLIPECAQKFWVVRRP
ncbi:MAG: class I SAM-dependent methyltransferase [Candidatus Krumholzibacteria bacterium]